MKGRLAALVLIALGLAAALLGRQQALRLASGWDQQVYVWQRVWTPQHADALTHSRDVFGALRVLALQVHPREGWREIPADLSLLKQDGRPLWLVARLDGQLPQLDQKPLSSGCWRSPSAGRRPGYPSPASRSIMTPPPPACRTTNAFYSGCANGCPPLCNSASPPCRPGSARPTCPAYCNRPTVPSCRCTRCSRRSRGCLTAPGTALVRQYAAVTPKPFRVALPAYGMALLGFDAQGAQVESESSLRVAGNGRELTVAPQQIADFLQMLAQQTPPRLRGIIWFRLPLADDRRAWSLATLRAVIERRPLNVEWQVKFRPQPQQNGLYDLIIQNNGPVDAPLPQEVLIRADDCLAADAVGNYRLESAPQRQRFIRISGDQLRAGQSRPLGWLRCQQLTPGGTLVTP